MSIVGEWDVQQRIWGWAVLGDGGERDALIAERGGPCEGGLWDLTEQDLAGSFRDAGEGWERVPDWWALLHLAERTGS